MEDSKILQLLENYRSYIKKILRLSILIDNYSLSTFGDYTMSTMAQLNKIQELFEKQRVYIRLVKYIKSKLGELCEKERKCLIHFYIKGKKCKEIEKFFPFSERTFFRHKRNGTNNFIAMVKNDNYEIEKLL